MPAKGRVQRRKLIHSIVASTFVHATEEEERVLAALRVVIPDEVPISKQHVTGHFGNPVVILKARIEQAQAIRRTLEVINEKLSKSELEHLKENAARYLDNDCNLFIRFDKQQAARGALQLGRKDPILVKLKLAAYPARRETALDLARGLWKNAALH
ncbi:MAG: RNA-binding domain-containing protein [Halobacteriota archaeon]